MNLFLKSIVPPALPEALNYTRAYLSLRHLSGPKTIRLADNEAAVTCLVRNGDFYLADFISHHHKLGFKHIIILDNKSTDSTLRIAKEHHNVSLWQTSLPAGKYQRLLKAAIARRTIRGGWCADLDIDEFFDFPLSHRISFTHFLHYLNTSGYTAVVTQMLDMFTSLPQTETPLRHDAEHPLASTYDYYDISSIENISYSCSELVQQFAKHNILPASASINLLYGGIRKALYGLNCLLTKHSLFSMRADLGLFPHAHFVDRSLIADVTCVLRHYKFTTNALAIAAQNRESFTVNKKGYQDFIDFLSVNSNVFAKSREPRRLPTDIADLIPSGFLVASRKYQEFAAMQSVTANRH